MTGFDKLVFLLFVIKRVYRFCNTNEKNDIIVANVFWPVAHDIYLLSIFTSKTEWRKRDKKPTQLE